MQTDGRKKRRITTKNQQQHVRRVEPRRGAALPPPAPAARRHRRQAALGAAPPPVRKQCQNGEMRRQQPQCQPPAPERLWWDRAELTVASPTVSLSVPTFSHPSGQPVMPCILLNSRIQGLTLMWNARLRSTVPRVTI
jgi:hypothetical protein